MTNLTNMVEYDPFIESMELIRNQIFRRGIPPSNDVVKEWYDELQKIKNKLYHQKEQIYYQYGQQDSNYSNQKQNIIQKINDISGDFKISKMQEFKDSTNRKKELILKQAVETMKNLPVQSNQLQFNSDHQQRVKEASQKLNIRDSEPFMNQQQRITSISSQENNFFQHIDSLEIYQDQQKSSQQQNKKDVQQILSQKQNENKTVHISSIHNPEHSNAAYKDIISMSKILPFQSDISSPNFYLGQIQNGRIEKILNKFLKHSQNINNIVAQPQRQIQNNRQQQDNLLNKQNQQNNNNQSQRQPLNQAIGFQKNDLSHQNKLSQQFEFESHSNTNVSMSSLDSIRNREYKDNGSMADESFQNYEDYNINLHLQGAQLKSYINNNQAPQSHKSKENTASNSNSKRSDSNLQNIRDQQCSDKFTDKISIDQNISHQIEKNQNMSGFPHNSIIRDIKNLPIQNNQSPIKQQSAVVRKQSNNPTVVIIGTDINNEQQLNQSSRQSLKNDGNTSSVLGKNLGDQISIISDRKVPQQWQGGQSIRYQDNSLHQNSLLEEFNDDQDEEDLFQEFTFDELKSLKDKKSTPQIRQKVLSFLQKYEDKQKLFFYENSKPDKIIGLHLMQDNKIYLVATQSRELPVSHTKIEYALGISQMKEQFSKTNFDAKKFFYIGG